MYPSVYRESGLGPIGFFARTGYFDSDAVARVRSWQSTEPRWITVRNFAFDMGLMGVIATQLWRHVYCGGGLADSRSGPPRRFR